MANTTRWVADTAWSAAFNTTDFTNGQMTNGQALLSTVVIANASALDMFMDVSIQQSIASSTIPAGANFALWICPLLADGTTYWAPLTAGTAAAPVPPWPPAAVVPLYAAATQTTLTGIATGIIIPPGSFSLIAQNNSQFTLTNTVQTWDYRTYNINLNV